MDEETAKEVEDLQNNLKALLHRKRKREEVALAGDNERLKGENQLLQDQIKHINSEKEQLNGENKDLKDKSKVSNDEIEHLKQRLASSIQRCSQANEKLAQVKQSNEELVSDNKRMKDEKDQNLRASVFAERVYIELQDKVAKQERTIRANAEMAGRLRSQIYGLNTRCNELQKYKDASQKAVSDFKAKLHLAIDGDLEADGQVKLDET